MKLTPPDLMDAQELRIGIISDTHGLLRSEAVSALEDSDVILHGGDVGDEGILDRLEQIAPTYTIRGNVDYQMWCGRLPNVLTLIVGQLKIHMIHDLSYLEHGILKHVDMVVYGHSHRPEIVEKEGVVFLNPGSAGPRRFSLPVTVACLHWQRGGEKLQPELIHLL